MTSNISKRLLELGSRYTQLSPETLKSQVQHTTTLSEASEVDFAELMADRAQLVSYQLTDPISALLRLNPRHQMALHDLNRKYVPESRAQGYELIGALESQLGPKSGAYTVLEHDAGLVDLAYANNGQFTRVIVDTTPGEDGQQCLIADVTPTVRQFLGLPAR